MTTVQVWQALGPGIPVLAAALVLTIVFLVLNRVSRAGIVARGTFREIIRQPVFILMIVAAAVLTLLNMFVPFFAFKDETKMFKDVVLSTVLVAALLLGIWSAANSISEEVEGRTAMTLLSKPIMRWQFILGKYLGIAQAVLAAVVLLGAVTLPATYVKYGYDQKETGGGKLDMFTWAKIGEADVISFQPERFEAAVSLIPSLSLVFLQAAVMASIAVALSTRLPMLVNLVTCFAIYVVGHLMPQLLSGGEQPEFVSFIAKVFASVLPSLDSYDTSAAIATGELVPLGYLGITAAYSVCYVAVAMLVAFILFEDHDLA